MSAMATNPGGAADNVGWGVAWREDQYGRDTASTTQPTAFQTVTTTATTTETTTETTTTEAAAAASPTGPPRNPFGPWVDHLTLLAARNAAGRPFVDIVVTPTPPPRAAAWILRGASSRYCVERCAARLAGAEALGTSEFTSDDGSPADFSYIKMVCPLCNQDQDKDQDQVPTPSNATAPVGRITDSGFRKVAVAPATRGVVHASRSEVAECNRCNHAPQEWLFDPHAVEACRGCPPNIIHYLVWKGIVPLEKDAVVVPPVIPVRQGHDSSNNKEAMAPVLDSQQQTAAPPPEPLRKALARSMGYQDEDWTTTYRRLVTRKERPTTMLFAMPAGGLRGAA